MKKLSSFLIVLFAVLFIAGSSQAQVSTDVTMSGSPIAGSPFSSLSAAITAVNGLTITGPVVVTAAAGSETTPAGGYNITATGTVANTILIQGTTTTTITAFTPQASGLLYDALFKIVGGDYITIQNFTMQENAANSTTAAGTNNMTEWGVALLYASTTNGAQNCTIQNNIISLNRTYQNTFGIYSNSTHSATTISTSATATTTTGGNSGLKIYGNNISNINNGIVVVGPTAAADMNTGIDIGGTGGGQANTITNYGTTGTFSSYANVSGTVNGILVRNSNGFNVSYNTVTSSVGGVTAGTLNGIQIPAASNTPTGAFTNNINNNSISLKSAVAAGAMNGISYPSGSASTTSSLNVNNNDFNNFGHTVAASGTIQFILNASTHQFCTINSNTFTNITVNTTGSVTFISHSYTIPASGTQTISSNSIVTAFNKTGAGGTVTCMTSAGSSISATSVTHTNNNFSNITVTGATTINGIANTDGLATTSINRTITGNTFNNWTGGANAITVMNYAYWGGTTSSVSNNTITNITGQSSISGLVIGASGNNSNPLTISNNTINNLSSTGTGGAVTGITCSNTSNAIGLYSNTIHTLSSTGASTVSGILISGATATSVYKNRIYNLAGSNALSTVYGITVSAGTTVNVYNNMISDLRASAANAANPLIGLNISGGTTVNAFYNTIYLNGSSTGGLFGSSAVYASTTPTVNLRNNIFVNVSTPTAPGITVAYRRSGTTLTSYSANSNNNDFYAGTPGANNLIYYDGTNSDQTINAYKTRVAARDASSFSENPPFINIASTPYDLHIQTTTPTQLESGGQIISSPAITDDYDGDLRNVTTPDVGADEFAGIGLDLSGPNISYTPLGNVPVSTDQVLTATITDVSGVPTSGSGLPVLYYKVNAGAYSPVTGVSIGSNQYTFTFGAAATNAGDVVSYYIVAQDLAGTPNVSCSPLVGASGFSASPPAASTPPTTPSTYTALGNISGTFEVGDDQSTLKKLTNVVAFINSSMITGNVTFELNSTYDGTTGETFPIVLPQFTQSGGWFYITIMPKSGAGARTTSGSSASSVIQFSNADRYILDGREGGTGSTPAWTIQNTNTAANTAAIHMLGSTNGSVRNTIRYCNLSCNAPQNTGTTLTFGIIIGGSSLTVSSPGLDNDSTTISNNVITRARYGIFINGALSTNPDQDVTISGNTIGPASFGVDEIGKGGIVALKQTRLNVTQNEVRYVGGDFANTTTGTDRVGIAFATDASWTPSNTFVTNSKITRNKVHHIVEERTFSAAGIVLGCVDGTNNTNNEVSNNLIYQVLANGTSGDYGVGIGLSAGQNDLIAYNSIYLTGDTDPNPSATATGQSAFCMALYATFTNPMILNNIGYMDLTSSSASSIKNACIGMVTGYNFGTGTLNYNNWYYNTGNTQSNTGNIGLQTSPTWYLKLFGVDNWYWTVQPLEKYSTQGNPGFVSANDLSIDATSQNAWNVSGRGVQVAAVTIDYTGATRSTTVGNGSTDLGAYNVTPSSTPPTATASALPAPSTTTTYTSGGREIASITWGAGGTVPTSIDVVYYPGANPPNSSGFQVGNCYWIVTATGGSGFTYDIALTYDEAQLGTIASEANIRLTKSEDGTNYTSYLVPGIEPGQYILSPINNTIIVYGLNSFSYFGITDFDAPLPVQLASFNASVDKRNVNLKWSTSTEVNNKGFEIERKEIAGNWSKIGYIDGNGNSTSVKNYTFDDKNLQTGKYNYRLKQIDNNGNFEYHVLSNVVEVGVPTKFDISQNYPNPFNPVTKIDFALPLDAKVSIKIYDMTGREVKTLVNEQRTAGYYTVQFNGSDISSGVYFYRIMTKSSGADYIMTKKMVLVK